MASATNIGSASAPGSLGRTSEVERRLGSLVAGSYRILSHIGSGSSSHVFAAEHTRLGNHVAVKILRSEVASSARASARFRREARTVARLRHEHIVSVFDCGELEDETPYLVMELLEGQDLRSLLRSQSVLPAARAVRIVVEACRALTAAHEAGLIHRDLKPENLFITRRSTGEDWCKVLDFGVAKLDGGMATAQGSIIGTVRYMAPEQLSDSSTVDAATDVYALGAVLYECLAGTSLWDGATVEETMYQIMNREPAALAERRPHLPRALTRIVHRSVERNRERRPQSAAEFASLLMGSLDAPVALSDSPTVSDKLHVPVAPWRAVSSSNPVVFVLVGLCLILGLLMRPDAASTPRESHQGTAPPALTTSKDRLEVQAVPARTASSEALRAGSDNPVQAAAASGTARPSTKRRASPTVTKRIDRLDAEKPEPVRVGGFDPANPYGE